MVRTKFQCILIVFTSFNHDNLAIRMPYYFKLKIANIFRGSYSTKVIN
jgi:hypothetical protein